MFIFKNRNKISVILTLMVLVSVLFLANKWMDGSLDNRSKAASQAEEIKINNSF
jgi:uncharacterized protein (UPF0333 family)